MSEYNIQMNKYNALNAEYDQLYPATKIKNVNGLDTALQNKVDASSVYTKEESISASTRTALGLAETATPDAALSEIARQLSESGGISMDLLWENPSITSTFPSQDLTVNLSQYDFVMAIAVQDTVDTNLTVTSITQKSKGGILFLGGQWSDGIYSRYFSVNEDDIHFGVGYRETFSGTVSVNNDMIIPYKIYGIKGVTA